MEAKSYTFTVIQDDNGLQLSDDNHGFNGYELIAFLEIGKRNLINSIMDKSVVLTQHNTGEANA